MSSDSGWDVATGPGLTALGLAAARLVESGMPDRLIEDPYAGALLAAVGDVGVPFPTSWPADGCTVSDQQALFLHGSRYIGLRTRFYDDYLKDACGDGIAQVVLLGSGLDARAYRLPWPDRTTVFDLDQPGVIGYKQAVLQAAGEPSCLWVPCSSDLRYDGTDALTGHGHDRRQPTAWLAEGLLPYLDGRSQQRLIEAVHACSAPNSRLAFDRIAAAKSGDDRLDRLSERSGMAMKDMLHTDTGFNAAAWLAQNGWRVQEQRTESLAPGYDRDLSDPFQSATSAEAPWLDTIFLVAHKER